MSTRCSGRAPRWLGAALALAAAASGSRAAPEGAPPAGVDAEILRGRELSRGLCGGCHLVPEPELLDRSTWAFEILPAMSIWLGLEPFDYGAVPGGEHLARAGVLPSRPLVSFEDWRAVCRYYIAFAPARPLPQPPRAAIRVGLERFAVLAPDYPRGPRNLMVRIDAPARRLLVGSASGAVLDALAPDGRLLASARLPSPPVDVAPVAGGLYVTAIGSFTPSDEPSGSVAFLPSDGSAPPRSVLAELRRPLQSVPADLDGDGRLDLVVAEFGHRTGAFRWFRNRGDGRFEPRVLLERPGALHSEVRDLDGDGRPDILVLMAQAREALVWLSNQGGGRFAARTLLEQHPAWGYTGFELTDANGDGHPDVLTTNGDNAETVDYPAPTKPYHGVRLYLNDGANHFEEAFFYPLNGAYRAVARDFDADGDVDIAAIAYFPDYRRSPEESFVYLENRGDLHFEAATFAESLAGRWIVMDAGDLDGDGDVDIALGAFDEGPGAVPIALVEGWRREGAAVLILRNQTLP